MYLYSWTNFEQWPELSLLNILSDLPLTRETETNVYFSILQNFNFWIIRLTLLYSQKLIKVICEPFELGFWIILLLKFILVPWNGWIFKMGHNWSHANLWADFLLKFPPNLQCFFPLQKNREVKQSFSVGTWDKLVYQMDLSLL